MYDSDTRNEIYNQAHSLLKAWWKNRGCGVRTKKIHYISNSWRIFSELTFSLDKNPNDWYDGHGVL
jgi:hypothetical protein